MTDLRDGRLDECADDAERVEFLRSQNDAIRAGNVTLTKLVDEAIVALREHGLHGDADRLERLSQPF